ncbi:hypothetical protein UY536_03790 [Paenibacillus polymyxa]|uniref:hypothetical protein n=1 Tax=Paenibacillus polymyxa TaxID=1406 RepID=UPI002AB3893C|nr:hypothetical protein [Paenibacillus polymyxa]MDY7989896.1 hypothetical protein [Paenibacillus polymyxa]
MRQEIRRRGIKVLEQHQLEDRITAKYLCRGYDQTSLLFFILSDFFYQILIVVPHIADRRIDLIHSHLFGFKRL